MLKNFKCMRCGECCRSPRLYKTDIERIKKLGYKAEEFAYIDNFGQSYINDKNGWCIFLNKRYTNLNKKVKLAFCEIYNSRPRICRLYPAKLINKSCKPLKSAFDEYLEIRRKQKNIELLNRTKKWQKNLK